MHRSYTVTHLEHLESEAIFVLREVAAKFQNPVLLFSGGKDSICVAHLAKKAFWPSKMPFPLMHVDTGHNFPETITFRDAFVSRMGARLIVASVQDSIDRGRVVEEPGLNTSRNSLQTVTLLDAINENRFDAAIGGAYRYFATPKRKFIIADTPGHIQYTRNMVTGASTANLAIVLVDARNGVIEQTCRHSFIASLLRIEHVVVAVNKMDLVNWSEDRFNEIVADYKRFASRLDIPQITFIPISALRGDNVVNKSRNMPWYEGSALLYHLETVYVGPDANHVDPRFPVQGVIRPQSDRWHDFRGYAGRVAGGVFKPGDEVTVLPSGFTSRIRAIYKDEQEMAEAFYPHSCVMTLEDDIDVSRGDMLVKPHNRPRVAQEIDVMICWFSQKRNLSEGDRLLLMHTTREVTALVKAIPYKVNVNTLHKIENDGSVALNEIARVHLRVSSPLFCDDYSKNRITGSLVLVDLFTHETVAGGMIRTTE